MTIALGALFVLAALASLLAAMTAGALHRSDPAGNGLAAAQLVVILAITWLLTTAAVVIVMLRTPAAQGPTDLHWPAISLCTDAGLALGMLGHFVSLPYLIDGRNRGLWRTLVTGSLFVVPAAFLLHAGWRGIGLPLPTAFALWGCAALVGIGSIVPWLARAAARRERARTAATLSLFHIPYPALLLRPSTRVDVVRSADDVKALPRELFAAPPPPLFLDANCMLWTLQPVGNGDEFVVLRGFVSKGVLGRGDVGRGTTPMHLDAVKALVLDIERLHPDAAEDARIRPLIRMQRDVTALSFLLPRLPR